MPEPAGYRHGYRVFVAQEVMEDLSTLKPGQRQAVLRLISRLREEPFREDYLEPSADGQRLQALVENGWALTFRVDHSLKEVLLLTFERADG